MPPSESILLTTFLLPPAPLPTILTLKKFTDLFPKTHRQNPQIKFLYRELQHARALEIDEVKRNIAREVKKGEAQMREVARVRRESERGEIESREEEEEEQEDGDGDGDMDMDAQTTSRKSRTPYTLPTILLALSSACVDLTTTIATQETELQSLLQEIEMIVGDLSDLRYGKFVRPVGALGGTEEDGGPGLREEVLKGLRGLEEVARERLRGEGG
ncbi:MAG: hypothetical protein MMC33_006740 [Icmadophila ericetorum]|nr:hypothetical protein [Icmadophila ericetorum]